MAKFSSYNEELVVNLVEDTGIYATGDNLKKYIPSIEDKDIEKFIIIKSKLLYVGTNEKETEIADRLGIGGGSSTSDAGATVKEVQTIVDNVIDLSEENKKNIPESDTDKTGEEEHIDDREGLIGTRLYDRSGLNLSNGNWNILIEYNNQNKETARYGSGYYWLKKGEKYVISGTEIEFKNDYVINYKKEEFTVLSGRAVNWNVNATLGVSENVALNLDPMSLANGEWKESEEIDEINGEKFENFIVKNTDNTEIDTGIQKVGDVEYDNKDKSLKINEDEIDNPDGEGGYLRLLKNGLDFSNGFTFEMYVNLSRFSYDNGSDTGVKYNGFFCRIPSLKSNYYEAMRFGQGEEKIMAKFCEGSGFGENIGDMAKCYSAVNGSTFCGNDFKIDEDFYLTVIYYTYKNISEVDLDEKFMRENQADKLMFYSNGIELGHTFLKNQNFNNGASVWNENCTFFVGVTPWEKNGNLYFTKGKIYSIRLYTSSLTPDEVKLNYDMTLKYRDSFKNE